MLARCVATLKPPPELTLSQWADRYRMLSAESSAEPGRWHTDKAPYQREIMDAIGDAHIRRVVIMCAAQLGKTELLLNILGYFMAYYQHRRKVRQAARGQECYRLGARQLLQRRRDYDEVRRRSIGKHQQNRARECH